MNVYSKPCTAMPTDQVGISDVTSRACWAVIL